MIQAELQLELGNVEQALVFCGIWTAALFVGRFLRESSAAVPTGQLSFNFFVYCKIRVISKHTKKKEEI